MANRLFNQAQSARKLQNGEQDLQARFDDFMRQVHGKSPQQVLQENGVGMPAFMNAMGAIRQMLGRK